MSCPALSGHPVTISLDTAFQKQTVVTGSPGQAAVKPGDDTHGAPGLARKNGASVSTLFFASLTKSKSSARQNLPSWPSRLGYPVMLSVMVTPGAPNSANVQ
jgi:hypothetical protein